MKTPLAILTLAIFTGCVGGPTANYYLQTGPTPTRGQYPGPVRFELVEDIAAARAQAEAAGAVLIGRSDYTGKHPEPVEIKKRARLARANLVLYSVRVITGAMSVSVGPRPAWASDEPQHEVHILFLGQK